MPKKIKSPILNYARQILKDAIDRIDNDECSEDQVASMVSRLNAESKGFHDENSYVTYDEAGRILHMDNRTKLKTLLRCNGIEQQRISNMRVGFLRSEVEALSIRLNDKEKPRERRPYRKKTQGPTKP